MRHKVRPEDFIVEEEAQLPLTRGGAFAIYRVRKRGATTLGVRASIGQTLGVREADVTCPAIKDKVALAVQHASVRGTAVRQQLRGPVPGAQRVPSGAARRSWQSLHGGAAGPDDRGAGADGDAPGRDRTARAARLL